MANGHVQIHDPLANNHHLHHDVKRRCSHEDDDEDEAAMKMKDTVEFRLLMAYATRRRGNARTPATNQEGPLGNTTNEEEKEEKEEEKVKVKKKKPKRKGLKKLFRCIRPQTEEPESEPESGSGSRNDSNLRLFGGVDVRMDHMDLDQDLDQDQDQLEDAAARLTHIADEIPFRPPELESDAPDDAVCFLPSDNLERMIALLLRETGDRLNEQELRDLSLVQGLFWNYGFFEKTILLLLGRMGLVSAEPHALGPQASTQTLIAVTCEATSRLSALDTLPMSRLMGYGARYLKKEFSPWAQEHGGYEQAFVSDDEDGE